LKDGEAMLFILVMTENPENDPAFAAIARIGRALSRIENAATRTTSAQGDSEVRYQALRTRTQAALASLEHVIAQIGTQPLSEATAPEATH